MNNFTLALLIVFVVCVLPLVVSTFWGLRHRRPSDVGLLVTSATAGFLLEDVGEVHFLGLIPPGTRIRRVVSSTSAMLTSGEKNTRHAPDTEDES